MNKNGSSSAKGSQDAKPPQRLRRRDLLTAAAVGGGAVAATDLGLGRVAAAGAEGAVKDSADVLIVGAGNTGIPAAIQAADLGAKVLLLEKNAFAGGMLTISGGHVSAANTKRQIAKGIEDSPQQHYRDAIRLGHYKSNSELLKVAVENAAAMVDWLEEIGVELTPESPFFEDDHEHYSVPRTYMGPDYARSLLFPLRQELDRRVQRGDVAVHLGTRVTGLIKNNDGHVIGVAAEDDAGNQRDHLAKAVILATGGYGASAEMKARFNPAVVPARVVCLPHATGDGILMAEEAGAQLVNMDRLIAFPGTVQNLSGEPTRTRLQFPPDHYTDGIWVNQQGQRFVNEVTDHPDERERAFLAQSGLVFFLIFDERIRQNLDTVGVMSWDKEMLDNEIVSGSLIVRADTLAELAGRFGIAADPLKATASRFNDFVASGADEDFGRGRLRYPLGRGPFYGLRVTGSVLMTHGGISVNHALQVKHQNDRVIPGLYAAGETLGCGQLMGEAVLSGMSVGPAITLGRLAARNAYQYAQTRRNEDLRPAVAHST